MANYLKWTTDDNSEQYDLTCAIMRHMYSYDISGEKFCFLDLLSDREQKKFNRDIRTSKIRYKIVQKTLRELMQVIESLR